jgi:hypothetical protein
VFQIMYRKNGAESKVATLNCGLVNAIFQHQLILLRWTREVEKRA